MNDLETRVELAFHPLIPTWGLFLGGAVGLLLLVLAWRSSTGVATPRRRLLIVLRGLALLLLVLVVSGPERVTTEGRPVRDPFVVLLDASRSMRVEDSGGQSRAAAVGAWLADRAADFDGLREEYDVRFFLVGDELTPWSEAPTGDGASMAPPGDADTSASGGGGPGSGEPIPADAPGTDLGHGLFGLSETLGGSRPAGAILVSDGADRAALGRAWSSSGAEGVKSLTEGIPFPVSVWTVGDPEGPADLAVRKTTAPPFGFVRRPLTVEADLSKRGLDPGPVRVTLYGEGELLAVRDVQLGTDEEAQVDFEVRPDSIGFHTFSVRTEVPVGDTIPSNNTQEVTVKVVRDRTRILQVTSRPSWDVKFLRRLLKTDPNIDLVSFFILRGNDRGRLSRGNDLSLIAFPYDDLFSQDLQGFDLVVFQNFWFGTFARFSDAPFMENLARYVEEGGAFLMVGGDVSFGAADYGRSPLARVMPTSIPSVPAEVESIRSSLTDAGRRHPVTRLDRDETVNEERWAALPALQGHNPLGALRDGGVSLVSADGSPVVAVRSVGKGRTMAVAHDSTWKWALSGASGTGAGREHAEFWRGAVRWLVKDAEQRQVQVVTDKENYRLGETVQVQVRVLGEDYAPRVGAQLAGVVLPLTGGAEASEFAGTTDEAGQYSFSFPASREGTLSIEVDVAAIPDPFGVAEARVSLTDRLGELEAPQTRPELMAAIAEATGGQVLGASPDPRDASREPAETLLAVDRQVEVLWSHPGLLLLLILPMGAEWVLRRRMGLR